MKTNKISLGQTMFIVVLTVFLAGIMSSCSTTNDGGTDAPVGGGNMTR